MPTIQPGLKPANDQLFSQARNMRVETTEELSDNLKRISLRGALSNLDFLPGQTMKVRIGNNDYRQYTPSAFHPEQGLLEFLIYLPASGAGSAWARNIQAGDWLTVEGPDGTMKYVSHSKHHFFFGDETSLGLIQCMKQCIDYNGQEYLCLLELDPRHAAWPVFSSLMADIIPKQTGAASIYFEDMNDYFWNTWKEAHYYLSGKAESVQRIRKQLLLKGVSLQRIQSDVYWKS